MAQVPQPVERRNILDTIHASTAQGGAEAYDAKQQSIDAFHDRVAAALVYPYALDRERSLIQRCADGRPCRDICGPILVTDFVGSSTGRAAILRVEMLADDGKVEALDIPNEDLGSSSPLGVVQLRRAGFYMPVSARDMAALLRSFRPRIVRGADVPPGWHPSGKLIFGLRDGRAVVPTKRVTGEELPFLCCSPDLEKAQLWRDNIGAVASGNPYVLFGLSVAFSGPLLRLTGRSGFGFNLVSKSSRGKSTLLRMMAAMWPDLIVEGWDHSAAGLEDICRASHSSLLLLDEMPRVRLDRVIDMIYDIMNGRPRNVRRDRDLGSLETRPPDWAMPAFSSSEKRLSDLLSKHGRAMPDGAMVRMIELVPSTLWVNHHGHGSSYDLIKRVEASLWQTGGVAGPAFVQKLVNTLDDSHEVIQNLQVATQRALEREFGVDRTTADGLVMRSLEAFACVATAGQLAARFGLLPQSAGDIREAVCEVARRWMSPPTEVETAHAAATDRLRDWLAKYAATRLVELDADGRPVGRARVADGWQTADDYFLLKDTLRTATRLEGNMAPFLRWLLERGILRRSGQPNSMQVRMGPAVHGRPWVYRIDRLALADNAGAAEEVRPG